MGSKILSNGVPIPDIGFGLWQVNDKQETLEVIKTALAAGYRHFDSAQVYGNEIYLGEAIRAAGIDRSDVFLTTKIFINNFGYKRTLKSFEASLQKLQMPYVDLLLLHFPVSLLRNRSWRALEEIYDSGRAKSIGVSNFTVKHLEDLFEHSRIRPMINQVELHVFLQQPELLEFCRKHDIVVEAYSPLAHGRNMDDPVLVNIAAAHGKSPAQIMLRWCVEKGTIPLPKSVTAQRIKDNFDITDFTLSNEDLQQLAQLDRNMRTCWDPTHIP